MNGTTVRHRLIVATLLGSLLGGCSYDMSDLDGKIRTIRKTSKARVEPAPHYVEVEKFIYKKDDHRDPFLPPKRETPDAYKDTQSAASCKGPKPSADRPRQPLEAFGLDSLRMVGSLEQSGVRWALVQTKDGTIHRVRPDHFVGQNHGKIVQITESQIDIQEIIENIDRESTQCPYQLRDAKIALSQ